MSKEKTFFFELCILVWGWGETEANPSNTGEQVKVCSQSADSRGVLLLGSMTVKIKFCNINSVWQTEKAHRSVKILQLGQSHDGTAHSQCARMWSLYDVNLGRRHQWALYLSSDARACEWNLTWSFWPLPPPLPLSFPWRHGWEVRTEMRVGEGLVGVRWRSGEGGGGIRSQENRNWWGRKFF